MEFRNSYLEVQIDVTRDEDGTFWATLDNLSQECGQGDTPQEAIEHLMQLHDDVEWWPAAEEGAD